MSAVVFAHALLLAVALWCAVAIIVAIGFGAIAKRRDR